MNASDYSPPNVNYWGDRCCKAEAEVERLRESLQRILDLNYGNESAKFIAEAALLETGNKPV